MFDAGSSMSRASKVFAGSAYLAVWAVSIWMIVFAWRTFKGWQREGNRDAILMALPAAAVIALMAAVNLAPR